MAEKDFLDITPKGVDNGQGYQGLKGVVFQDTQLDNLRNNPERLTKEGIEKKIELWKQSSNVHAKAFYNTMLRSCKSIEKSGVTADGRTIFSRDAKGNPKWVSNLDKKDPSKTEKVSVPETEKKVN